MSSYHNTTNLEGQQLELFNAQVNRQERIILEHMRKSSLSWHTPEQIHLALLFDLKGAPITSVRRALSNLTKKGFLVKSETANAVGNYGKPVHTWRISK